MIKPFKILLFGLSVLLLCIGLFVFVPGGTISVGTLAIRIPEYTLQKSEPVKYKDISGIISLSNTLINDTVSPPIIADSGKTKKDTLRRRLTLNISSKISADSLKKLFRAIEYPEGQDTVLFSFFNELGRCSDQLIRILHYGDSQIEGDRITSYLRNQLQLQFGGEGIGLFPVVAVNPASISFVYDISENWQRYTPLQNGGKTNKYGVLLNCARIAGANIMSAQNKEIEAWIHLKYANISYPLAQRFKQCQVYYGFNKAPMMVELKQNDSIIDAEIIPSSAGLNRIKWNFNHPLKNLTISFKATETPDVYAISLDGNKGIAVDNIPVRGSSGLEFTKSDPLFMSNFYKLLNVKMLIMQFGVNVVPNIRADYSYYKEAFYQQLKALKSNHPDMSIIVIGVSDVSRNGANGLESYPNIELIRDAQRNAAFDAGCAFWDMYEAMGGKNSMPSWVNANPPLAQKDFTHFNPVGARIIAEMFYRALMIEYDRFLTYTGNDLACK